VVLNLILATLAVLSLALTLWQFVVAMRFPLHQRVTDTGYQPPVTLLKPLKGADADSLHCLESWLRQDYAGPMQVLFGVASAGDPVCEIVRQLTAALPGPDAQLVICGDSPGANSKVATLVQLHRQAKHDVIIVSDADVHVAPDVVANVIAPLRNPEVGLVNCFYRLANPCTLAMHWEAVAVNADFWSQVLQSQSLKPLDFALGAVMATTRKQLDAIGGFEALVDFLADDYQLGNRIVGRGGRIVISPVVVECRESPKGWPQVWRHQLRWARTIRVCQPLPYFFSILGNATLWPLLWLLASLPSTDLSFNASPGTTTLLVTVHFPFAVWVAAICLFTRVVTALDQQRRLNRSTAHLGFFWLVPVKDLLGALIWALAFLSSTVEWRGQRYRVRRGGRLVKGFKP